MTIIITINLQRKIKCHDNTYTYQHYLTLQICLGTLRGKEACFLNVQQVGKTGVHVPHPEPARID